MTHPLSPAPKSSGSTGLSRATIGAPLRSCGLCCGCDAFGALDDAGDYGAVDRAADALNAAADLIERLTQPAGDTKELIERAQAGPPDEDEYRLEHLDGADAQYTYPNREEWWRSVVSDLVSTLEASEAQRQAEYETKNKYRKTMERLGREKAAAEGFVKSLTEELSASEAERVALKEELDEANGKLDCVADAATEGLRRELASREEALREAAQKAIERMASMGAPPLVWRELANALAEPPPSPANQSILEDALNEICRLPKACIGADHPKNGRHCQGQRRAQEIAEDALAKLRGESV